MWPFSSAKPGGVAPPPPLPTLPVPPPPPPPRVDDDGDRQYEELDPVGRYLALASRVGRLFGSASRYSAYSSDVGEAFRPVAPRAFVWATYGLAFGYVGTDILYNSFIAEEEKRSVKRAVAHATVFQGLASLLAPFVIIHTAGGGVQKLVKDQKPFVRKWSPTVTGLAIIPLLPSMVDEPIEHAVHTWFHEYWPEDHPSHKIHHHKPVEEEVKDVLHWAQVKVEEEVEMLKKEVGGK